MDNEKHEKVFRCHDPESEWIEDQRHSREARLLSVAVARQTAYEADPVHYYQELVTEFGRDDANTIMRWIESLKCNTALQFPDLDSAA
jgi:hypothetical protein